MPTIFPPCGYAFQGLGYVIQSLKCLFQALEQRTTTVCRLFIACEEELSGLRGTFFSPVGKEQFPVPRILFQKPTGLRSFAPDIWIVCPGVLSDLPRTFRRFAPGIPLLVPQRLRRRDAADASGRHVDADQHHGQQK